VPIGEDGLTYVGHATTLLELVGARLLTDPLLGAGILHVRRRVPVPPVEDLGPLTAILISHAHRDHLDHRSLRRLPAECPLIAPRGCAAIARRGGARDVIELAEGDRVPVGEVIVEAVHADHDGRRNPVGRRIPALGYLLEGRVRVYFAGDTDLFPGMSDLAGRVDVALLPVGGWGPRVPAGHLDSDRAAEAVARIRPRLAVPIHWGTLRAWGAQRHLDPIAPARSFAQAVAGVAPATEVCILTPGQRLALPATRRDRDSYA
jgi:L-ascorbate metabolism protein UlaG (beta-lactamase superfamily)